MAINCEQYLAALPNRQCMEEFLKRIPRPVQQNIADAIEIIRTITTVQKIADAFLYQQYLVALALLKYQIEVLKAEYATFFEVLNWLKDFIKWFRN